MRRQGGLVRPPRFAALQKYGETDLQTASPPKTPSPSSEQPPPSYTGPAPHSCLTTGTVEVRNDKKQDTYCMGAHFDS